MIIRVIFMIPLIKKYFLVKINIILNQHIKVLKKVHDELYERISTFFKG